MRTPQLFSTVGEMRMSFIRKRELPHGPIRSSSDLHNAFMSLFEPDTLNYRETMWLLCLQHDYSITAVYILSEGAINATIADVRMIFQAALMANAINIAIAHNHPSGQLKPSQADIHLTKKVQEAGKIMDIALLDHLIVTRNGYMSFGDEGLL